jgi:hypothetical protein
MPILFTFDQRQVLLWLVEFQEDKKRFSIYKLLRYVTDLLEQYPEALLIPTVLFTERIKWRTDVKRELKSEWGGRSCKNTDATNELCTRREIGSDSTGIPWAV